MSAGSPAQALTPARVWWHAARPATLAASVSPVLLGCAVAAHEGGFRALPAVGALAVGVAMQVGVNYANDYSDFVRGADTPARIGPLRAAASGLVAPGQVRKAAIAAFGLAAVIGLALSLATDWRLLLVGALAVAAGWLYTGGPRPYGYLGLGELFVFVFFGLVATAGTVYVQELRLSRLAWLGAVAMGLWATAILAANNLRDVETDARAGKRTLAVRLGRPRTRAMLAGLLLGAALCPPLAWLAGLQSAWALVASVPALVAAALLPPAAETAGPPLVAVLKLIAGLQLGAAVLWSLALLWS